MKKNIFYIFIIFTIFLSCCKYDKVDGGCVDIKHSSNFADGESIRRVKPCFNPNNGSMIVFIEFGVDVPKRLCTYNLVTNEKTNLIENTRLSAQPKWGKSDWILLSIDGTVWKIKSDGSGFIQLTFSGKDYSPEWVSEDKFVTDHKENQSPMIMYDLNGVALDTFSNGYSGVSCSYWGNRIIFGSGDAYKTIHLANDSLTSIPYGVTIKGANVIFIGENEVMRSDFLGIYRRNLNELKDIWVHDACTSRFYGSPSYSPQRNQVLWEKVTIDDRNNFVRSRFVIMNIDGTGEEELVIP